MNGKDEILLGPDHKNKILKNISREGFAGRNIENALKSILRKADHVTVMGRMSKKFVVEGIGISQEKVSIITGTVDLKRFNSTDRREEIYDIVMVSGLKPHKRIDRFIDTLVLLKKDIPGLRCVLIGGGEALKVLTETSEKKGLKGNLEFAGWVKHPEEYLKKSKVFVLTSDTEGLSKAMIEAMACGLPVVCTDVGDAKDIIISGETGYRVSSMAPEDISDAVVKLLRDDDIRRQMGKKAELLVEKEYSIVSEVDKWRALIRAASEKQQSRA